MTLKPALPLLDRIGYPVIVRPAFTLGGGGGGVAYNEEELREVGSVGLDYVPHHPGPHRKIYLWLERD